MTLTIVKIQRKSRALTRIFHIPAAFISKALKAAAVVSYRKALITKLMEAAGTPVR